MLFAILDRTIWCLKVFAVAAIVLLLVVPGIVLVASGSAEALALVEVLGSLCELVASLFSHRTTPRGEDP